MCARPFQIFGRGADNADPSCRAENPGGDGGSGPEPGGGGAAHKPRGEGERGRYGSDSVLDGGRGHRVGPEKCGHLQPGKRAGHGVGGRRIHFGAGADLPKTIDLQTREIRATMADDVVAGAIISDAMINTEFTGSYGLPGDVRPGLHYIRCFQLETIHSKKPIFITAELRTTRKPSPIWHKPSPAVWTTWRKYPLSSTIRSRSPR